MANRNRKKIFQFISKLRNVAYNNVILFLHVLICQILKNRYIVHRCQGTKSGIFIHHTYDIGISSLYMKDNLSVLTHPSQTRIHQRRKKQSLKVLTNSINFGIKMILFLFPFCLYSLNFPFDIL